MAGVIDYSSTAGSNTTIGAGALDIAEGCDAANINDAIRLLMKDIRDGSDDGNIMGSGYLTKAAGYTVAKEDRGKTIDCTAALTLTLTAAATVGAGWLFFVKANGGAVTIDPNASETIDGSATLTVHDGDTAMIICDGSNFHSNYQAAQQGVWRTLTTITASNQAAVEITDIPSDAKVVEIYLNNVSPVSDGVNLYLRTSTNNGSSYDSTAGNYEYSLLLSIVGSSPAEAGSNGAAQIALTSALGTGTGEHCTGVVRIHNPGNAAYCSMDFLIGGKNSTPNQFVCTGHAYRAAAADVDAVQFTFSSGNVNAGVFTARYFR